MRPPASLWSYILSDINKDEEAVCIQIISYDLRLAPLWVVGIPPESKWFFYVRRSTQIYFPYISGRRWAILGIYLNTQHL